MNLIINLTVLIITIGFLAFFLYSMIINLIRAINVNKKMKTNPDYVIGKVIDITNVKNRVYVRVEYITKITNLKFNDLFEFSKKEFNDRFVVGQEVKIYYPHVENEKKVLCFPTFIEGKKIGIDFSLVFTDFILVAGGIYIFLTFFLLMLAKDPVTNISGLEWNGRPMFKNFILNTVPEGTTGYIENQGSGLLIVVFALFFYVMVISYVLERIKGMVSSHKTMYLKLCGTKGTAEVITYKFGKAKNAQGQKEAQMKIEFFTNTGEKVACDLNSCLYSETQEQFINILYDAKNPKNVVYMRK